jgi:hypothetical protein
LVRGGPGTGKTVIAVQLLADALREGFSAVHSTGGKAFTTAMRSKFAGASGLFVWNMSMRNATYQALDLLLVDEAHRIRETSDTRWTPRAQRAQRAQIDELLDASKVAVFFLDENQFMRPDEEGNSNLVREATGRLRIPLRSMTSLRSSAVVDAPSISTGSIICSGFAPRCLLRGEISIGSILPVVLKSSTSLSMKRPPPASRRESWEGSVGRGAIRLMTTH